MVSTLLKHTIRLATIVNIPKESNTDYSVLTTESGEQEILSIHSISSF